MAYKDSFKSSVSCGSCDEEGTTAVSFCHNCGCFLCHACIQSHRKMRTLRDHKLSTTEELQENKYNPKMQTVYCEKHPKKELIMFCSEEKCMVPICDVCGHVDHRGHNLAELTVVVPDIINTVQQSCARSQERNQELIKKRAAVETLKESLTKNFNKKKKDLQESEQNLYNKMHTRCSDAHKELQEMYDAEMQNMNKKIESIDSLSSQITSACEFATNACDMSLPTQLLSSHKQIMNRLYELEKTQLPDTESLQTEITFTLMHYTSIQLFQVFLLPIWKLYIGPRFRYLGTRTLIIGTMLVFFILASLYPSQIDPSQCTIELQQDKRDVEGLNIGPIYKATLQTADNKGNNITTGGARVDVSQLNFHLDIQDNNDGTYEFEYYSFGAIHVNINGKPIWGSPFNDLSKLEPKLCIIRSEPKPNSRYYRKTIVQTIDSTGYHIKTGGVKVVATSCGWHPPVHDNKDGTYWFEYEPGCLPRLTVTINGKHIKGSPFDYDDESLN
ncbi:E3 ubiquitin-protein ligase TRIM45-like [Amphiura filiformis]|uniref:E3 ubiquitin-protein ligase TRIM45-like n=1 Tax=Amphiura filiformis TaxID=82378 RepID=UPI003B213CD6